MKGLAGEWMQDSTIADAHGICEPCRNRVRNERHTMLRPSTKETRRPLEFIAALALLLPVPACAAEMLTLDGHFGSFKDHSKKQ